jgi:hypothetical protein
MTSRTDAGSSDTFTLIDAGTPLQVEVSINGSEVRLSPAALAALGWELHAEGLCRAGLCLPVPAGVDVTDLAELAVILDRPLAIDLDERAAYVGVSAGERAQALRTLEAPDFTLPDLEGRLHSLSQHRGKKILLVVYASW